MPIPIQSITFWLNAFLPRDIAGYTTTLRHGPYTGLTALVGSRCCLTDQRDFSNDIRARSRLHSEVMLDFSGSTPVMTQGHRCDYLIECNREDGEVRGQKRANIARMKFVLTSVEPSIVIHMDCAASSPCAPAPQTFGKIAYTGTIVIDPVARSIAIDLMIGLFPAFEAYAAINGGRGAILFRHAPPAGVLSLRLPAGAQRRIRSWLEARDGDGLFELPAL